MKRVLFIIIAFVFLIGCERFNANLSHVDGVISDIWFIHEDGRGHYVFVEFNDGRITKLRSYFDQPISVRRGVNTRFWYDKDDLMISVIEEVGESQFQTIPLEVEPEKVPLK